MFDVRSCPLERYLSLRFVMTQLTSDFLFVADTPQGALPILDVDGKVRLCQSFTIARFVARELGKYTLLQRREGGLDL